MLLSTLLPNVLSNNTLLHDPPYIPSDPNPENGATSVSIYADLSWTGGDPEGDNVTYDVYFGTTSPPSMVSANQSNDSYDPGTLEFNTTYYWRIVAWDEYGESSTGPIWNFTTRDNSPPNMPLYPQPPTGADDVSIYIILSWTGGDPDGDDVYYDVYFGKNSPPPKVVSKQTPTTYNPGTLEFETKYYWQIVAWDEYDYSTTGPIWNFTTRTNQPPNTPSNPTPEDGAINVVINTDIEWDGGDPDGDSVTYDIFFGTTTPPPLVKNNHTSTKYKQGTMNYSTKYYWKIIAYDQFNTMSEGPIWSFTTEEKVNQNPIRPTITGVKGIHVPNRDYDYEIVSVDPDGDDVLYYIDWGDGTFLYWFGPYLSGQNVTKSHSWPPKTKLYEIQVKAKDIYGAESDWGTMYVFVLNSRTVKGLLIGRFILRISERLQIFDRIFRFGNIFTL